MSNSESSQKLKIGNVVKLKSGGPKMTVDVVTDNANAKLCCVWFPEEHFDKVESYSFSPGSLQLIVE